MSNTLNTVKVAATQSELAKFARGSWQLDCIDGNQIVFPTLRGKAGDYRSKYELSLANMLDRIAEAGYEVEPIPGPRGGRPKMWRVYRRHEQ